MLTTTQVLLVSLLALYRYGVLSASASDNDYYKLMYSLNEDKRGYVFDKEKRPRYDFGIGKRSLDLNRQKMYSFGLGKRNPLISSDYDHYVEELIPFTELQEADKDKQQDYTHDKEKRRQYDFGIGKRVPNGQKMYAFGLGKRNPLNSNDYDHFVEELVPYSEVNQNMENDKEKRRQYDFGLGKREPNGQRMYAFGLGKRDSLNPSDYDHFLEDLVPYSEVGQNVESNDKEKRRQYDFGIGKRVPNGQKMYAFGLGKRSSDDYDILDGELRDDYSKRLQPYGFGLGKRAAPAPYSFGLGKRHVIDYGISQRSQRYNFGLGKRSSYNDDLDDGQYQRFLDAKRSRYNFGLGKRSADAEGFGDVVPFNQHELYTRASQKFNFGLGKREISKDDLQRLEDSSPTLAAASSANIQRRSSLDENNSLLDHQQHSGKTKDQEAPSSAADRYNLQDMPIKP